MAVISLPNATTISASCPTLPQGAKVVTKSDADTYDRAFALWVGGAGTVTVTPANGATDVLFTMPAGAIVPIEVIAVKSTGTTATELVALY